MSDEPVVMFYMEPDKNTEEFQKKVFELLTETRELGPLIHTCLLAQVIGHIMAHNPIVPLEEVQQTTLLNLVHGYNNAIHDMMEKSAEGKPN